jgi:hypothetical protein
MKQLFSPVYLTTKENGLVTRGLPEITKERPVLFICNHTFVGFDLGLILGAFLEGQGVIIRSLAHPLITIGTCEACLQTRMWICHIMRAFVCRIYWKYDLTLKGLRGSKYERERVKW